MTPQRILIVYGTTYGHTAKIADQIADTLMADGHTATLVHAHSNSLPGHHKFDEFDGVMVGASVIRGKHQKAVARFVRRNLPMITRRPSAFFSVSSAAVDGKPGDAARARGYIAEFLSGVGWQPSMTDQFGGATAYTRYGPILRWIMKRSAQREGGPADTSRDHEFTNWKRVEQFARAFVQRLPDSAALAHQEITRTASGAAPRHPARE